MGLTVPASEPQHGCYLSVESEPMMIKRAAMGGAAASKRYEPHEPLGWSHPKAWALKTLTILPTKESNRSRTQ